jgi:hypothetical protein
MINPPHLDILWLDALRALLPHIVVIAVSLFMPILVIHTEAHNDSNPQIG